MLTLLLIAVACAVATVLLYGGKQESGNAVVDSQTEQRREPDAQMTNGAAADPTDTRITLEGSLKPLDPCKPFYVYAHRGPDGVFYIGKGVERRVVSLDGRHSVWHTYVRRRCGGAVTASILDWFATNDEAEDVEAALIIEFGANLVNWNNPSRGFDYPAIAEFHRQRNLNRELMTRAKEIEKIDLTQAIDMWKTALLAMYDYESIVMERGVVAEMNEIDCCRGDVKILDRLLMLLNRAGRYGEVSEYVDGYLSHFPKSTSKPKWSSIVRRVDRAKCQSS